MPGSTQIGRVGWALACWGLLLLGALFVLPGAARAQGIEWSLRGGLTLDPDGFAFGGDARFRAADFSEWVLVPSVDLSIGSEGTLDFSAIRVSGNGHYYFSPQAEFTPFALGGASLYFFDPDVGLGRGSSTDLGLNVGGGLQFGTLATELWLSFGGVPDLSVWVTYTFP